MSTRTVDADLVSRRSLPRSQSRTGGWFRSGLLHLRHPWLVAAIPTFVICLLAWAYLAPPQLGGSTTYVITDGVSMLPNYQAGDLVLLRKQPGYQVGEVAGYHNAQLGVTVMHRIVASDGNRFIFKGDNNSWRDSYHPLASEIVGAEWVHLPGWGNVLMDLRTPAVTAIILGVLWLLLFLPRSTSRRQRRRRRHAR